MGGGIGLFPHHFLKWPIIRNSDGPFYNGKVLGYKKLFIYLYQNSMNLHENAPLQSIVWDIST